MKNKALLVAIVSVAGLIILTCSNDPVAFNEINTSESMSVGKDTENPAKDTDDTTRPYVVFAYPGGAGTLGGCEVEWGTPVIVVFSEPIDPRSVSSSTFDVGNGKDGRLEVCGNTVVYKPITAFDNLVVIQVTVSGAITDTAGNAMGDDYTFVFYTRGEP
jgi:hypothetical protein